MRNQDEIQKAHDILHAFILGEVPMPSWATEHDRFGWVNMSAGLCFAMGDDHPPGRKFEAILAGLNKHAEQCGFKLKKMED